MNWRDINATRVVVAVFGIVIGISGMNHGVYEILQGNTPTDSLIIMAIGEGQRMWEHGGEAAFTIIPNFLITGILAVTTGIMVIVWSVFFIQKKYGRWILLLLFILLFLFGGGIAQLLFFALILPVATRIDKPLNWWRKVLKPSVRRGLARLWIWVLIPGFLLGMLALVVADTGFMPGVSDPDLILTINLSMVGAMLVLFLFASVAGFAHDIERLTSSDQNL
ncbi:MAG: hypothetical protein GTO35_15770, partial [Gammaproteobacteria bacterium]|nr:hypothetical protein [Gammaproteobacteria bacterium]